MNIDTLRRRIDRAIVAVERARPQTESSNLDLSLLTPREQDDFAFFLSTCPQPFNIRTITDEQLDLLSRWSELLTALERGDQDGASRVRRWLSWSCDELLVRFRAIRPVKNASYPFNAIGYSLLACKIEQQRLTSGDWQAIREWCELASGCQQDEKDQAG